MKQFQDPFFLGNQKNIVQLYIKMSSAKPSAQIVTAEWGQIYFAYDHLIIQTCCLQVL